MAKTNDPHPDSFLHFLCLCSESVEYMRLELPFFRGLSDLASSFGPFPAPLVRSYQIRRQIAFQYFYDAEVERAQADNVPQDWLASNDGHQYVLENTKRAASIHAYETHAKRGQAPIFLDGRFRPRRQTVVRAIVGQLITSGGCDLAKAARLLSAGIPERDSHWRLASSNVRDASVRFWRGRRGTLESFVRDASLVACQARSMRGIWDALPGAPNVPSRRRSDELRRLFHTREMHERYELAFAKQPLSEPKGREVIPLALAFLEQDLKKARRQAARLTA